ncbi:Clavata3/ESR (CLE) [Melia azedarach]|uniref:Clavata3/ESR (CLE) n=1 Tax=Melia azedarach TaxID=155640 RepID=A0ACC1XU60_MELAZ|nr:Clavata3/ESR (CLE) [Melia azedarach]
MFIHQGASKNFKPSVSLREQGISSLLSCSYSIVLLCGILTLKYKWGSIKSRESELVNMGGLSAVLLILLIFVNFGILVAGASGISNFTQFDSSCNNVTLEDKRGVPTGANPLHNR